MSLLPSPVHRPHCPTTVRCPPTPTFQLLAVIPVHLPMRLAQKPRGCTPLHLGRIGRLPTGHIAYGRSKLAGIPPPPTLSRPVVCRTSVHRRSLLLEMVLTSCTQTIADTARRYRHAFGRRHNCGHRSIPIHTLCTRWLARG